MGKKTSLRSNKLTAIFKSLGENIRLARLRRCLSTVMLAERAGMTRMTLYSIENGEPTVSLGGYANVLFSLGLERDLSLLARDDEFGRKLQDISLMSVKKKFRQKKDKKNACIGKGNGSTKDF